MPVPALAPMSAPLVVDFTRPGTYNQPGLGFRIDGDGNTFDLRTNAQIAGHEVDRRAQSVGAQVIRRQHRAGGVAGVYKRNRGLINTAAAIAGGLVLGPAAGALIGAGTSAVGNGKPNLGEVVEGGLEGYTAGTLGAGAKVGAASLPTGASTGAKAAAALRGAGGSLAGEARSGIQFGRANKDVLTAGYGAYNAIEGHKAQTAAEERAAAAQVASENATGAATNAAQEWMAPMAGLRSQAVTALQQQMANRPGAPNLDALRRKRDPYDLYAGAP